jgi:chemotaxis response regulator CheB
VLGDGFGEDGAAGVDECAHGGLLSMAVDEKSCVAVLPGIPACIFSFALANHGDITGTNF